jgi:hypothetical protein
VDEYLKKFKDLTFKGQLGVYAGIALFIGAFLPFSGFDFGFGIAANAKVTYWGLGFLVWAGGIAGAVLLILGQRFLASVAYAAAAVAIAWALIDTLTTEGMGLKFGSFFLIAAAAVALWSTIDALIAKAKDKKAMPTTK